MRQTALAALAWLLLTVPAFPESAEVKTFAGVLNLVTADYVSAPHEPDLVKAAIEALIKREPNGSAADYARTRLGALPAGRQELVVAFDEVFEKFRRGQSPADVSALLEAAIGGMVGSLDQYSSYLSAKNLQDMQTQTRGEFGGIGIEVTMENGLAKIVAPIDGAPAARTGLQSGDLITRIDGQDVMGLTLLDAVGKMRGPVHSTVNLTIQRKGAPPFEVGVVRDTIRVNPVKFSVEDDVGYIRVSTFNEQTAVKLTEAVDNLKGAIGPRLKGFIIDLRNDPGGLLDQAVAVSDAFLEDGLIVSTRGRDAANVHQSEAKPGDIAAGQKLVLLINGGSVAASEIVAGALQDHHRAVIVGTTSFGKGSVQTIFPLDGGGAVRLTTALYYTPSGRSIQLTGVTPDSVVEPPAEPTANKGAETSLSRANLGGHPNNEPATSQPPRFSYVPTDKSKDTQLAHALNLLRGSGPGEAVPQQPAETAAGNAGPQTTTETLSGPLAHCHTGSKC